MASILCAFAPSFTVIVTGRFLQGIGAAFLMPNSLAILGSTFSGEAKGQAIGAWAGVGALSMAVGPLLGGWLIDAVGWRSIFLINLPFGSAAIFLAIRYVPENEIAGSRRRLDLDRSDTCYGGACNAQWEFIGRFRCRIWSQRTERWRGFVAFAGGISDPATSSGRRRADADFPC